MQRFSRGKFEKKQLSETTRRNRRKPTGRPPTADRQDYQDSGSRIAKKSTAIYLFTILRSILMIQSTQVYVQLPILRRKLGGEAVTHCSLSARLPFLSFSVGNLQRRSHPYQKLRKVDAIYCTQSTVNVLSPLQGHSSSYASRMLCGQHLVEVVD